MSEYTIDAMTELTAANVSGVDELHIYDASVVTTKKVTVGSLSNGCVAAGATLNMTTAHASRMITLNATAGSVVTLPTSTGSGYTYKFVVSTLATSNSHVVQVANTNDVIKGMVIVVGTGTSTAVTAFATTTATIDTITLNRTTTGSVTVGEWLEVTDATSGTFLVRGMTSNSGTAATPFSAAV